MGRKSNAFYVWQQLFKALNVNKDAFYASSFKMECRTDCKKESNKLKIKAHQMFTT